MLHLLINTIIGNCWVLTLYDGLFIICYLFSVMSVRLDGPLCVLFYFEKKWFCQQSAVKGNAFLPLVKFCFSNTICRNSKNNCIAHSDDLQRIYPSRTDPIVQNLKSEHRSCMLSFFGSSYITLDERAATCSHQVQQLQCCEPVCQLSELWGKGNGTMQPCSLCCGNVRGTKCVAFWKSSKDRSH